MRRFLFRASAFPLVPMDPLTRFKISKKTPIMPLLITLAFPCLAARAQPSSNELILQFVTGGDDLRGGNDNVLVALLLQSGTQLRFDNVNARKRWPDHSSQTVNRPLPDTLRFEDIKGVRLETTFAGGMMGDNWNLDRLTVSARIGGETRKLFDQQGAPLFRFTGNQRVREFPFSTGNELIVQFVTGSDDLRGGNDNVHLFLLLHSRTGPRRSPTEPLRFDNVNGGNGWPDHSSRTVSRPLPETVRFEDIEGVRLETTFGGGVGGDNWNLDRLTVSARIGGVTRQLFDQQGAPLFRFTGDQRVRAFRFGRGAGRFDFNLDWGGVLDLNGFPLNPRWSWQLDNPGVPSAELCHYFTNNGYPDFADCTNQTDLTMVDTPVDWDSIWCAANPIDPTKGFGGHLNWFTVTFTGTVWYGDEEFWDGDYYIALGTDLNHDGKVDGLACITGREVLHTEFDSRETINYFQTRWWKSFRSADKATRKEMMKEQHGGSDAIMTGLFGVDLEHGGGKSELHPVYAMAVKVSDDPADSVWAIFVRNTGNEGYCSHRDWPAEFTTYTFRLPWQDGMREVEMLWGPKQSQFGGTAGTSGPAIVWALNQGVDVTFTLPPPSERPLIEGELHLRWHGQPPVGRLSPTRPAFGPERVEKHAGPVSEAFDRLPPAKRRQVEKAGQLGPTLTLHPLSPTAARKVGVLPAPPAQAVRLGKKGGVAARKSASSTARLRALCEAWNGSPPGFPPDFCAKIAR